MEVSRRRGPWSLVGAAAPTLALLVPVLTLGSEVRAAPGDYDVAPTNLMFPATYVGATSEIAVVVTNTSGGDLTPSMAGGAPFDPTNFGGSQNCAGTTLAAGESCAITYTFEPESEGSHSTTTSVTIDGESFAISMSGTALYPYSVAPTDLAFPDTAVGETSEIAVVFTNVSSVAQSPSFAGGAPGDPAHFGGSQNCAGATLAAGATCTFTYTFEPASTGALSTTTSITVDGKSFPISLSGTGTDPGATTTTTSATSTTTSITTTTDPDATTTTTDPDATTTTATETTQPTSTVPATVAPTAAPGTDPASGPLVITTVPGPLGGGTAQVIAQGIVDFPAGSFEWAHQQLDTGGWPFEFTDAPPVFFVADGPDSVHVATDDGLAALLDRGEAVFVPVGSTGSAAPLVDGAVAGGHRITFVAGSGATSFAPGQGRRDVNLIRDVVAPGATHQVSSPFPVLVAVVEGGLVAAPEVLEGEAELTAGTVTTLDPTVELRNGGDAPAIVLAAAVGGQVP